MAVALLASGGRSAAAAYSAEPDADAFVRATRPADNYGGAGALAVSGSSAVNAAGQANGASEALLRFPLAQAASSFDAVYGVGQWVITGASLELNEVGNPRNPIFNLGAGQFAVTWLANDQWTEGTGSPSAPGTSGIRFPDVAGLLGGAASVRLGTFPGTVRDGPLRLALPVDHGAFRTDLSSRGEVTFYLQAIDPTLGLVFNSRNYGVGADRPLLELTAGAVPEPATWQLLAAAALVGFVCRFRSGNNQAGMGSGCAGRRIGKETTPAGVAFTRAGRSSCGSRASRSLPCHRSGYRKAAGRSRGGVGGRWTVIARDESRRDRRRR
jgi:hypothetical protein